MQAFLDLISSYHPSDPTEIDSLKKIIDLVKNGNDPFGHYSLPGHITGSALVINPDRTHTLLNHHKKLNKWVQFGGHSDGDFNVEKTALRESFEESGLRSLRISPDVTGIFDVDVHEIPASQKIGAHTHHDIRFLLVADMSEPIILSPESYDIKWVALTEVATYSDEKSLLRMIDKVVGYNLPHESQ
jgi:8-oxo-dGTP pyrophosphatase MutT (NUDIX family)